MSELEALERRLRFAKRDVRRLQIMRDVAMYREIGRKFVKFVLPNRTVVELNVDHGSEYIASTLMRFEDFLRQVDGSGSLSFSQWCCLGGPMAEYES